MSEKECLGGERQLKPAAEVAAGMVSEPVEDHRKEYRFTICDDGGEVVVDGWPTRTGARHGRTSAVGLLARLIERERAAAYAIGKADGAMEERERVEADAAAARARTMAILDGILGPGRRDRQEPKIEELDPEIVQALFGDDDHPG